MDIIKRKENTMDLDIKKALDKMKGCLE